ncbi:hypothetical protein Pmar_PMAR024482 [Perkinsus marinus ATCC 50983]|uniref:Uncharacterized protein n=1 Tax=Perkinsus marinus (strain ATCC 50983 / TXsc) TaxID=423536 RepID=C5LT37_PERM5|nr:hypothetical protein Pmar_PMAR024482 [Perkinsus marinus ATCC 50983]EER00004.1 hypothetical protein Pmar_PMAR024482 [Perkinsus marinus ATCC 50983]|eukprot:XP_002767286.1 hypothetical protein Pmar_PMAR024482 [Perkinsus marinus ATCC 50983]
MLVTSRQAEHHIDTNLRVGKFHLGADPRNIEDTDGSTTTSSTSRTNHIKNFGLPPPSKIEHSECEWDHGGFGPTSLPEISGVVVDMNAKCVPKSADSMSLKDLRAALQASHKRMMAIVEEERELNMDGSAFTGATTTNGLCQQLESSEGYVRLRQWAERSGFGISGN